MYTVHIIRMQFIAWRELSQSFYNSFNLDFQSVGIHSASEKTQIDKTFTTIFFSYDFLEVCTNRSDGQTIACLRIMWPRERPHNIAPPLYIYLNSRISIK